MIRRDYLLRMIEQFVQALAQITRLAKANQFEAATVALDEQFLKLLGSGAEAVSQLSETELMARLMAGEPTQVVRDKCLMLVALLKEAAGMHAAQNKPEASQACHLKALNLLLDMLLQDAEFVLPVFAPKVDELVAAVNSSSLPLRTNAALVLYFERAGQFAKAEDALFAMLDTTPQNAAVIEMGIAFYERLLHYHEADLIAGNLPRHEVEAGLAELRGCAKS